MGAAGEKLVKTLKRKIQQNLSKKISTNEDSFTETSHFVEALKQNYKVLALSDDWLTLAYLEPLLAKKYGATINHGDRAMRSLNLF